MERSDTIVLAMAIRGASTRVKDSSEVFSGMTYIGFELEQDFAKKVPTAYMEEFDRLGTQYKEGLEVLMNKVLDDNL